MGADQTVYGSSFTLPSAFTLMMMKSRMSALIWGYLHLYWLKHIYSSSKAGSLHFNLIVMVLFTMLFLMECSVLTADLRPLYELSSIFIDVELLI